MSTIYDIIVDFCKCGYKELKDLKEKQDWSYEAIKEDLSTVKEKWQTLNIETKNTVEETKREFSSYTKAKLDESKVASVRQRAKELHKVFTDLSDRHYRIEAEVEVNPELIMQRYKDSQTRQYNIEVHGKRVLVAVVQLGAIIGGLAAWKKSNAETKWIVCGALVGATALGALGALVYFIFKYTADSGVSQWGSLKENIPELEKLDKTIESKTQNVKTFLYLLNAFEDCEIAIGSDELIKQCDKYLGIP